MPSSTFCLFLCWICSFYPATTEKLTADDQLDIIFKNACSEMSEHGRDLVKNLVRINHLIDIAKLLDQQPNSKQTLNNERNNLDKAILLEPITDELDLDEPDQNVKLSPSPESSSLHIDTRIKDLMYDLKQVIGSLKDLKTSIESENNRQLTDSPDFMSGEIKECVKNMKTLTQVEPFEYDMDFSKRTKNSIIEDYNRCHSLTNSLVQQSKVPNQMKGILTEFIRLTAMPETTKSKGGPFMSSATELTNELLQIVKHQTYCMNQLTEKIKQNLEHVNSCRSNLTKKIIPAGAGFSSGSGGNNIGNNWKPSAEIDRKAIQELLGKMRKCCANFGNC